MINLGTHKKNSSKKGSERDVQLKVQERAKKKRARLFKSGCQVVLPQLEAGRLCRVTEVNTHGNRH